MMKRMRTLYAIVIAAGMVGAWADEPSAPPSTETRLSKPVPTFTAKNLDGLEVCSTNYAGKTRLIVFFASWDKPSQREVPALVEIQRDLGAAGVAVLGLSLEQNVVALKEFAATNSVNFPILLADYGAIQGFGGLEAIPTIFVVEPHGVVVSRFVGYTDKEVLRKLVQAILDSAR